jgi:hypothetical protein
MCKNKKGYGFFTLITFGILGYLLGKRHGKEQAVFDHKQSETKSEKYGV